MKIMVFDVPAEHGGALTVLNQYYDKAINDKKNEWIFVISTPELEQKQNVRALNYQWIKKSWLHRLWFDNIIAKRIVKEYKPDKIISLQNTAINTKFCPQELYVHQALVFCQKRFSVFENKVLWIYQNIIGKLIIRSIKKVNKIIVQTQWMKNAIVKKTGIDSNIITVEKPAFELQNGANYKKTKDINFFYPANGATYKNHYLIYEAVKLLREKGYKEFNVYLTIDKPVDDADSIAENIFFCGYMNKDEMRKRYESSALLFPSYVESFGLPLLEAREYGCPIIASDCDFSKEILAEYDKCIYFNPFSVNELADSMIEYIDRYNK